MAKSALPHDGSPPWRRDQPHPARGVEMFNCNIRAASGRRRAHGSGRVLTFSASASAERTLFFEETAEAFWAVPFECADGSTVQGTLLVRSTRDFEAPDTEDPEPTARVQFLAVCQDGTSFSWGGADDHHEYRGPQERHGDRIGYRQGQPRRDASGLLRRDVDRRRTRGDNREQPRKQEKAAHSDRDPSGDVRRGSRRRRGQSPTRSAPFIRVDTEK
jgi:hypothetical protein